MSLTRRNVLIRDSNACQYCGNAATTLDHVTPISRGGGWSWSNLVACCARCNASKGAKTPKEARMTLARVRVTAAAERVEESSLTPGTGAQGAVGEERDLHTPGPDGGRPGEDASAVGGLLGRRRQDARALNAVCINVLLNCVNAPWWLVTRARGP